MKQKKHEVIEVLLYKYQKLFIVHFLKAENLMALIRTMPLAMGSHKQEQSSSGFEIFPLLFSLWMHTTFNQTYFKSLHVSLSVDLGRQGEGKIDNLHILRTME